MTAAPNIDGVKALAFDVGGTVLDWHTGICAQAPGIVGPAGGDVDWPAFANAWRMAQLRGMLGDELKGETDPRFAGLNIDGVSRGVLDDVLPQFGLGDLDGAARDRLARLWHDLPAWPGSAAGHARLHEKYLMSTLTILSISLIMDVSRSVPFQWDCVISCEMLGVYKMNPKVYRLGAKYLDLEPGQIMMVAAHNLDLMAAAGEGYRTAFIRRPTEWGDGPQPAVAADPDPSIDVVVDGLDELADVMGA